MLWSLNNRAPVQTLCYLTSQSPATMVVCPIFTKVSWGQQPFPLIPGFSLSWVLYKTVQHHTLWLVFSLQMHCLLTKLIQKCPCVPLNIHTMLVATAMWNVDQSRAYLSSISSSQTPAAFSVVTTMQRTPTVFKDLTCQLQRAGAASLMCLVCLNGAFVEFI